MIRKFLLILLLPISPLFAQSYKISVFGTSVTDTSNIIRLYRHSANQGKITVLDIRRNKLIKNFRVKTMQGDFDKKDGLFIIKPGDTSRLQLDIYKGRKMIGQQTFIVKDPPEPLAEFVTTGNKKLNNGFIADRNDPISVIFHPDSTFAARCPADRNYKATLITVVRNGNIRTPRSVDGSFKLNDFGLKSDETIKLELNRYTRINYKGEALIKDASPEDFLILKIR